MEVHDIELDESQNIKTADGDFCIGEATRQNQTLLLLCQKGEWKQHPDRCVGVETYLERSELAGLNREILTQFSADGMQVRDIKTQLPEIKIEAEYYES